MKTNALNLISRIREAANKYIIKYLEENNLKGIVPSHGDILAALFEKDKYSMKEMSEKIHRTKATLTVLVDKLIDLGFIEKEKDAKDNRISYIKLTNKGHNLKPVFEKISNEICGITFKDFSQEEIKNLEFMLIRIKKNLD